MRRLIVVALALLVAGCAGMDAKVEHFRADNRENTFRLSRGISRDSALAIMGIKTVEISNKWEVGIANIERHRTVVLSNPYRSETMAGPADTLEVLYYYTDAKNGQRGAITDDDLTPLVFKENRLLGWGYSVLHESVQKYEIRYR